MKEQWKDIAGYEGLYKVSNYGRIKSLPHFRTSCKGSQSFSKGKILKPIQASKNNKYLLITLSKEGHHKNRLIHLLVLEAFRGACPKGKQACHFPDPNPSNNRLTNLRWDTPKANAADRTYHGRTAKGWKMSASKTALIKRFAILDLYTKCGYSLEHLAKIFEKPTSTIEYLIHHTQPTKGIRQAVFNRG